MQCSIIFTILLGTLVCAFADDDAQYVNVKSVKGGYHGGLRQYNPGANFQNFYNSSYRGGYEGQGYQRNTTQQGFNMVQNTTAHRDYEIGVCYIEIPTASLVRDPKHIPAGNGSRPDLSRVRSCCKGYIRNIHNFKICEPVCSMDCVNALCTAPETCTCFPDHVKNLAGYCIPTCPIGCQNGHCSGGECLCENGYKLDSESKFCLPNCKENCGGIGNCTAPNTCECKQGYQSSRDGNCKPICNECVNGECIAPNECRCNQGFSKNQQNLCVPQCPGNCAPNGRCVSPGRCEYPEAITTTTVISPPYQPSRYPNQPLYPGNQVQQPNSNPNYPGNQHQVYPMQPGSENQYNRGQPNQYHPGQPGYQANTDQNGYNGVTGGQGYVGNQNNLYPDLYQYNEGVQSECSLPCLNGVCVEGNRCRCNPGYVLDRSDQSATRCIPNCPGGCPNGVCSAPNFCICNMGYYKDHSVKGRPVCVKRN
ncbi:unnamed protein product [Leptidea sinapis]|uniref:EGF-like domain-containing protein n=1 Tax=Leptidea sinapis TaxID=189913 RepID=A0A5E4QL93_9NEOP|nr:unnamed protein product [Leptidea sinapis]